MPTCAASSVGLVTIRPVAAAAPLTPLLTGPRTAGSVLAVFAAAAVIGVDTTAGPRIVALLAAEGSGVPNGVRLPLATADRPFAGLQPGAPVTVGARDIVTGAEHYRLARTWRTAVPVIRPCRQALAVLVDRLTDVEIGVSEPRVRALAVGLAAGEPRAAVRGLVGLGRGLTPGGDDVLAGTMIGLRAVGRTVLLQQVRRAVGADIADRTTAISVDLLRLAATGQAGLESLAVLGAIHAAQRSSCGAGHLDALTAAIDKLLAIGHTSGADLATGLLIGLRTGAPDRPQPAGDPIVRGLAAAAVDGAGGRALR